MLDPYIRRADVTRVVDGDTVRLHIDLGFNVCVDHNVRLLRVNAPEMKSPTAAAGLASKIYVEGWVVDHALHAVKLPTDWPFTIRSEKADVYGRYLVDLWCGQGHNLSEDLVRDGYAVPFMV